MSNLIHCDGPDCDKTRDPEADTRVLGEFAWITAGGSSSLSPRTFDFHSHECLAKWAEQQDAPTTTVTGR